MLGRVEGVGGEDEVEGLFRGIVVVVVVVTTVELVVIIKMAWIVIVIVFRPIERRGRDGAATNRGKRIRRRRSQVCVLRDVVREVWDDFG